MKLIFNKKKRKLEIICEEFFGNRQNNKKKTCMKFKRKLKIQLNWLEREKKLRKKNLKKKS